MYHLYVFSSFFTCLKAWLKMRDELIALLERAKATRIRGERRVLVLNRLKHLATFLSSFYASSLQNRRRPNSPSFFNFALMPRFQEILLSSNDVEVTVETFQPLLPILQNLIKQWQEDIRIQFRAIVSPHSDPSLLRGIEPLDLATSAFTCTTCRRFMHYPDMLSHTICHPVSSDIDETYQFILKNSYACQPFSTSNFSRLDDRTKTELQNVIKLCGEDPATVTKQQMDNSLRRVTCVACNLPGTMTVMTYDGAVRHILSLDYSPLRLYALPRSIILRISIRSLVEVLLQNGNWLEHLKQGELGSSNNPQSGGTYGRVPCAIPTTICILARNIKISALV